MLVFMGFGKLTGSWEKVPHKSENTKWSFSKSFPFLRVLAPIQHDNCCSSCSSICATVNQINRGTQWGPKNGTYLHHISRSLGSPLSVSVITHSSMSAPRGFRGYLCRPMVIKLVVLVFLFCFS